MTSFREEPRVVAIVQARMGSTRLPGKVMKPIAGKPLLWHVLHRLKHCRTLDDIAVATSTDPRDDAIESFCREEGIEVVRGPEDDVLARFALAAKYMRANIIVRVSADAPFIDAEFVDHLVTALIAQNGDYVVVEPGAACAHDGVDPFTRRALNKLVSKAAEDPVAREHVSGYFKLHPEFVRVVHADPDPRLAHAPTRLTIDTPDDLAFIEALHERMQAKAGEASLADLLLLLEREPKLKSINAHVRQKPVAAQGGFALISCDGGGLHGYGHMKRSLTLGRALRDREGFGVAFVLNGDNEAGKTLRAAGFETTILSVHSKANTLVALIARKNPDILVCDARENLGRAHLTRLAAKIPVTAVIDDSSDRRLAASHAYFPPVPQVKKLSWTGARTTVRAGWEWALLGLDPSRVVARGPRDETRPLVIVSMGGSDPLDLTRLAACALSKITAPLRARFVIGPGFRNTQRLSREIEAMSPHFEAVQGAPDLAPEFAAADLALVSFGVTAYELAALGVPALYITLTDDHSLSASAFAEAGMGIVLGLGRVVRAEDIARAVWKLSLDEPRRRDMRAAGLNTVDGMAASRIAADLAAALADARAAYTETSARTGAS
jgi:spore coat polysaccharide biosynthesis protein SpsF